MNRQLSPLYQELPEYDLFCLKGSIDVQSEWLLKEIPGKINHELVRFDFSRAGRIDSMGIALLLECFQEIRKKMGVEIRLEGLTPLHSMLFGITGVFQLAKPLDLGGYGEKAEAEIGRR